MSLRSSLRPSEATPFSSPPPRHSAAGGPALVLSALRTTALASWVPTWWMLFHDPRRGGFHERLQADGAPQAELPRRLLTQCRQLYVYSHAHCETSAGAAPGGPVVPRDALQRELARLQACYRVATTGGWRFSTTAEGIPHDDTYDLYGHAFVLLALAHLFRATGDRDCLILARQTLVFMRRHFASPTGGYHEQLDAQLWPRVAVRRQNPHMHLFEACLAFEHPAIAAADRPLHDDFAREADALFALFTQRFWHAPSETLIEHLTGDLRRPHPKRGHELEPGHHYEWALLLQQYAARRPSQAAAARAIARQLHAWAEAHALHPEHGAVVNLLHRGTRQVLDANHRIWHIAEALRATVALGEDARPWAALLGEFVQEDGRWAEVLDPALQPVMDAMPGTTPYHLLGAALI